jgi:hypothetical protein
MQTAEILSALQIHLEQGKGEPLILKLEARNLFLPWYRFGYSDKKLMTFDQEQMVLTIQFDLVSNVLLGLQTFLDRDDYDLSQACSYILKNAEYFGVDGVGLIIDYYNASSLTIQDIVSRCKLFCASQGLKSIWIQSEDTKLKLALKAFMGWAIPLLQLQCESVLGAAREMYAQVCDDSSGDVRFLLNALLVQLLSIEQLTLRQVITLYENIVEAEYVVFDEIRCVVEKERQLIVEDLASVRSDMCEQSMLYFFQSDERLGYCLESLAAYKKEIEDCKGDIDLSQISSLAKNVIKLTVIVRSLKLEYKQHRQHAIEGRVVFPHSMYSTFSNDGVKGKGSSTQIPAASYVARM